MGLYCDQFQMLATEQLDWQPLDSKMLAAVAFVPTTETLYLCFPSGEIYCSSVHIFLVLISIDIRPVLCGHAKSAGAIQLLR
jgi:hypothetical protein